MAHSHNGGSEESRSKATHLLLLTVAFPTSESHPSFLKEVHFKPILQIKKLRLGEKKRVGLAQDITKGETKMYF